jgi:hypothetical protein
MKKTKRAKRTTKIKTGRLKQHIGVRQYQGSLSFTLHHERGSEIIGSLYDDDGMNVQLKWALPGKGKPFNRIKIAEGLRELAEHVQRGDYGNIDIDARMTKNKKVRRK